MKIYQNSFDPIHMTMATGSTSASFEPGVAFNDGDDQLTASQNEDLVTLMGFFPHQSFPEIKQQMVLYKNDPRRKEKVSRILEDKFATKLLEIGDPGNNFVARLQNVKEPLITDENKYNSEEIAKGQIRSLKDVEVLKCKIAELKSSADPPNSARIALMHHNQCKDEPPLSRLEQSHATQPNGTQNYNVSDIIKIAQWFVDVDPKWAMVRLNRDEGVTLEGLVKMMLYEPNCFDRMRTRQGNELIHRRRSTYMDSKHFSPAQFLKIFPDPDTYFKNMDRPTSILYSDHTRSVLMNDFPRFSEKYLKSICKKHKGLLYPIYTELKGYRETMERIEQSKILKLILPNHKIRGIPAEHIRKSDRKFIEPWPNTIDEKFFRELQFVRWESIILNFRRIQQQDRESKLEAQKQCGRLQVMQRMVCHKCYEKYLLEEIFACQNEHRFCKTCISKNIELKMETGYETLDCLELGCSQVYSMKSLNIILSAYTFDKLMSTAPKGDASAEIIENLHCCPFCNFSIIEGGNSDTSLVTCLNSNCIKVFCRICLEENHLPLKCDEVEKGTKIDYRYINYKVSETLKRICPKCNKKMIKTGESNLLRCNCGLYMCFLCQTPFKEHEKSLVHFNNAHYNKPLVMRLNELDKNGHNICPLESSIEDSEREEARKIANELRMQYMNQHPDLKYLQRTCIENLKDINEQSKTN